MKLVLEGGGVRAAYAAGVCEALLNAGTRIDAVVGSSSGSINAAFVASGQPDVMCRLWREKMPGKRFINYGRQFSPWGRPGLDVDHMLDDVIRAGGLLDERRAVGGPTTLYVTATDVDTGECVMARPARDDLWDWLRASLALPVGYNRIVTVNGRRFIDGGVSSPVPFDVPLSAEVPGPVVVVLTRPMQAQKPPPVLWERIALHTIVPSGARELTLGQHHLHNKVMKRLADAVARDEVMLVEPPSDLPLARLTRDAGKIRDGIAMGQKVGTALAARLR